MGITTRFAAIALGVVLAGAGIWFGGRIAVENVVRDYLLQNPEILAQASENLQRKQASQTLAGVRQSVETPFPGAVLGNPNGHVTMVEFSDYACGYCRQSLPDVAALIARNPDLRIVVRELPIISPHSADAAKLALAAAEQGKYAAFHDAMFAAGQITPQTMTAVAAKIGLDMDRAKRVAADPVVEAELNRNIETAGQLGFTGTPSWIVGERTIPGAVGIDKLAEALKAARPA